MAMQKMSAAGRLIRTFGDRGHRSSKDGNDKDGQRSKFRAERREM